MNNIGIISYNIYGNFTNYGSALQSWALHRVVKSLGYQPILIDYCPDILAGMDPLNPYKNLWDQDEETIKMCQLSMPDIYENYYKFNSFYTNRFFRTKKKYTSKNFNDIMIDENLYGFICGSDTIFCVDEFGFDDGYYANFDCMHNKSISYAASFGDSNISNDNYEILNKKLQNFNAIGLRESKMIPYVTATTSVPVKKVIDPTLLLSKKDYKEIEIPERIVKEPYLLYYSRRYSPEMEKYVEKVSELYKLKVVEISLRHINQKKGHIMKYAAGVEEFLSLIRHSEYVVTNSYHGMIFAVQYKKPFDVFLREQCNNKIDELLTLLGLENRKMTDCNVFRDTNIDYEKVHNKINIARKESIYFLNKALEVYLR